MGKIDGDVKQQSTFISRKGAKKEFKFYVDA
jgi:hypothetical protein